MTELRPWLALIVAKRARVLIGALLIAATLFSAIGLLALSGWFITATGVTAMLWAAGQRMAFDVYVPGGGIRFFALTRTVARYTERIYNHNTVLGLLADLRSTHFAALARLDGATLSRLRAAQWLNRLTADIDTLDTLYLRLLAPPAVALLGVLLVCGVIALFHLALGVLLGVTLLILLCVLTFGMAAWAMRLSAARVQQLDLLRTLSIEQLQGLAELTAAGTLARHQAQLLQASHGMLDDQLELQLRVALGQALATAGVLSCVLIGFLGALWAAEQGTLSGPIAVLMTLALLALGEGLAPLPGAFAQYGATRAAAARLNQQVALTSQLPEPVTPHAVPAELTLNWDATSVGYAGISRLDLTIPAGTSLAIIGPSGCGKSTLAQLAARLIDPDSGEIRIGGTALNQLTLQDWRAQVGYLTQQTELLHDSIAANLLLAAPDATDAQLWDVLERVELADMVEQLPTGLDTWVGESGKQLSGGEGRRLALARVLLKDSPVVILDEPFNGLDKATAERVRRNIEPWLARRTVLLLGHAPDLLPRADRTLSWSELVDSQLTATQKPDWPAG
ncbi:thiol reductant ABC exporter subunit CydC [Pseudomonas sp. OIL-1]|uniref:thiol reductant ABC exporter subunit CydC n=1 Tax=Pseudomonas sp. OIL-1 TaxID=2706126 RepID=UPI0013A7A70A|nr:thiol reductant ABC exporter subunit CydC [Pseudomonas sp. OIL-1]QIB49956.1 thiol reductant ABC exporter subunit CydC [Pseudomonas sp. OIL-1]